MRKRRITTVTAALLGAAVALTVGATGAQAAPTAPAGSAEIGSLVLEPAQRGYEGTLAVEVVNRGTEPAKVSYVITEPAPNAYQDATAPMHCNGPSKLPDNRKKQECDLEGEDLAPGERRGFTLDFRVLTAIRSYAMRAPGGHLAVKLDGQVVGQSAFRTLFRSSTGSLTWPRRYVADTVPSVSVRAGDTALVRQPDGTYAGRIPVTVRYNGDAPHSELFVDVRDLPAGVDFRHLDPIGGAHFGISGGEFGMGEERTFDVVVDGTAELLPGDLGAVRVQVTTDNPWYWDPAPDVDPTDNVATVRLSAVAAA